MISLPKERLIHILMPVWKWIKVSIMLVKLIHKLLLKIMDIKIEPFPY